MNALKRRFSSVRTRLLLWNTLTLALVLIALGALFRLFAANYLLNALDRDIKLQAQRFQESHRITMLVVSSVTRDGAVHMSVPSPVLMQPPPPVVRLSQPDNNVTPSSPVPDGSIPSAIHLPQPDNNVIYAPHLQFSPGSDVPPIPANVKEYRIYKNVGGPSVDQSGQYLYRAFDREGKPLSSSKIMLPFAFMSLGDAPPDESNQREKYRPWDPAGFQAALAGHERIYTIQAAGASLRVLSQPLHEEEDKIVGVVQIATPLGQVNRDIAGLTRLLLFILPPALLVAAGAGLFLTNRALRPVKSLTLAATGISPNQLSQRLPVSGADEFDELASAFNRALDRVELSFREREQMMEQLRRFTGDASHELRTPLTVIKTNTSVALAEEQPSQEHIHALQQIDRAADRMTSLVQDLLLLARSEAGQIPLDLRPLSLHEVVNEAIEMFEGRPHAPIQFHEVEAGLTVRGASDQLCRLFLNLLENAVRYTPEDGQIHVTLDRTTTWAVVRVRDTGCGIAPEHLPHLGERFYRADAGRNRKQGGSGLGLAICRSILTRHQGEMSVESEPGQGTTVTVWLPLFDSARSA